MSACTSDQTPVGARDAAIIALGHGLGLRRAEIAKMQLDHYSRQRAVIAVRSGKGNTSRTLPIDDGAKGTLEYWLSIRGDEPSYMFCRVNKGGSISSRQMNVRAIDEAFERHAK